MKILICCFLLLAELIAFAAEKQTGEYKLTALKEKNGQYEYVWQQEGNKRLVASFVVQAKNQHPLMEVGKIYEVSFLISDNKGSLPEVTQVLVHKPIEDAQRLKVAGFPFWINGSEVTRHSLLQMHDPAADYIVL